MLKFINYLSILVIVLAGLLFWNVFTYPNPVNLTNQPVEKSSVEIKNKDLNQDFIDEALKPEKENNNDMLIQEEEASKLKSKRNPFDVPSVTKKKYPQEKKEVIEQKSSGSDISADIPQNMASSLAGKKNTIQPIVETFSKLYKVDTNLVLALIEIESNFDETLVKKEFNLNKVGLMQIDIEAGEMTSKTIGLDYNDDLLLQPNANIQIGTYILSELQKENDDLHFVINNFKKGAKQLQADFKENNTYESDYSLKVIGKMQSINQETNKNF